MPTQHDGDEPGALNQACWAVIALLLRFVVVPVNWWTQHQLRRNLALNAEIKARAECRCGICGVMDDLSAPIMRGGHNHTEGGANDDD